MKWAKIGKIQIDKEKYDDVQVSEINFNKQ